MLTPPLDTPAGSTLQTIVELFGYKGDIQLGPEFDESRRVVHRKGRAASAFSLPFSISTINTFANSIFCYYHRGYHYDAGNFYLIISGGRRPTMHLRHGASHLQPRPLQHHLRGRRPLHRAQNFGTRTSNSTPRVCRFVFFLGGGGDTSRVRPYSHARCLGRNSSLGKRASSCCRIIG